jgi:hypothetical protein
VVGGDGFLAEMLRRALIFDAGEDLDILYLTANIMNETLRRTSFRSALLWALFSVKSSS